MECALPAAPPRYGAAARSRCSGRPPRARALCQAEHRFPRPDRTARCSGSSTGRGCCASRASGCWRRRSVLAVLPLVAMTVRFGHGNVQSIVAVKDSVAHGSRLAGWLYYARLLPAAGGLVRRCPGRGLRRRHARRPQDWRLAGRRQPAAARLAGAWRYLFFSAIDLKDAASTSPSCCRCAFRGARDQPALSDPWANRGPTGRRSARGREPRLYARLRAGAADDGLPARQRRGSRPTRRPTRWWLSPASATAPSSSTCACSTPTRRHTVIRADKLLLGIAIRRELGVVEKKADPAAIIAMLQRYGVATSWHSRISGPT